MDELENRKIGPYTIVKPLGRGAYAEVYLVEDGKGKQFAMKVMKNVDGLSESQLRHLKTEIKVMKTLCHPNVIRSHYILASQRKLFIVMDFIAGGNMLQLLQKQKLNIQQIRIYLIQLMLGMEYCHDNAIAHRDIKGENILLSEDHTQLFITDFGLSAIYIEQDGENKKTKQQLLKSACGSPYYVAPEVLKRKDYEGEKADVWSCGILLYLMFMRHYPFDGATGELLQQSIMKGEFKIPPGKIEGGAIPLSAVQLIHQMLATDPAQRPTFKQCLDVDFVKEDTTGFQASWRQQCVVEIERVKKEKLMQKFAPGLDEQ